MIFHIVRRSDWDSAVARGLYEPSSLAAEGFMHCSTLAQLTNTAARHFRGQTGLVVLGIDESRLRASLKYEPPAPVLNENPNPDTLFPHIYGALNLDAVVRVIDFPSSTDGTFELPDALANLRDDAS
jgi:uncharacterized protein (DUF952 family)